MKKLQEKGTKTFASVLMQNSDLTEEQAEAVFTFQISGCLAFNRMMLKTGSKEWKKMQHAVDRYIGAGLRCLAGHDKTK